MPGLDPIPQTIDHLVLRGAPGAPALTAGPVTLTYAQLDNAVTEAAARLAGMGITPGDRVASWMGKTLLACILPLACARAGFIHVPINPALKRPQTAHILADSQSALLIANKERLASLVEGDLADARALALDEWESLPGKDFVTAVDTNALVALFYTSGSTGRAKGVMLTNANLWLGAISVAHYLGLGPQDRTLCVLPLAFDYGQNQLLSAWAAGSEAIAFDYLLPRDVVRAVERHDVTVLAGVPPLWLQLAETEWGEAGQSLRTLTNSGGHLPLPVVRRLRATFPEADLHLMYGLTEAFRSTSLDPSLVDNHPDSVGKAIPFAEVTVVRGDGTEAAADEEGELVHSGPLVAQGYWRDPERTAQRFRPAPAFMRDGGFAVWTGDTVVRGADNLIRFRGRDDAMIKVSGNRISPTEIEEAALASGAVTECLALGVPDDRLGQAIVLIAVPRGEDALDRLRAHLARELPSFMRPREVQWRETLPINANGKVDRARLVEELA